MRTRKMALMIVVLSCAIAQGSISLLSMFLSWPIQDVERRQAMVEAGFPGVVFTTRPATIDVEHPENDAPREIVGAATDKNGLIRVPWDSEMEIHLSYALSGGSVEDAYITVGGLKVNGKAKTPSADEPDPDNRFGDFDKPSQIIRLRHVDMERIQRRYNLMNSGGFRAVVPYQIVSIDPVGERKEKTTQAPWTLFIPIRTVSKRATWMSQTLMVHYENFKKWHVGAMDEPPTPARELRNQIAMLRMWGLSSVDVSGDLDTEKMFLAIEPQMQVWVSSPQVVVEYLDEGNQPAQGPMLTGLVMFFRKGATVPRPWLPGQPLKWYRLNPDKVVYPAKVQELLRGHNDLEPYILLWQGDRSHAHFMIHQATLDAMPTGLKCGFLALSSPVGTNLSYWKWNDDGGNGVVVPLTSGGTEQRLIQECSSKPEPGANETDLGGLFIGLDDQP